MSAAVASYQKQHAKLPAAKLTSHSVTLNGSGIQLAVGPQPLRLRNHNFGLAQRIMVKRLATSRHDPLGITDSACKNQLVVVSVQYGPFNPYIPIRSTTIGESRVARDLITMHTSWRSNSDIASVTRVSMKFRVVRTNQYNQDLGLIHSTNGNHLESPNEGSSIDHQVTIYLHAQNITMFPTNEICKAHNPCSILSCKQAHICTSNLLCNNFYKQGPSNADPPPSKPTQATTQRLKHKKATAGSYELNQRYPTPSNSAESSKQCMTRSEHLPQQARSEMLTDYTREMSLHTSPASSKRSKTISKRSVSAIGVQRYHSHFNRSCLPSTIE
ncbi:hypothetical protein F511_17783 [Dorcoceras hygrometricum]|uniref:Uncharacterized protein n=1 Tax=Dorcoceras hygrometricum TaxID=472368 RepID=A0A2Z7ARY4_9LAMI|nr:hypothetical protein F511_17783 [Dorcoceras hygrometricum]